WAMAAAPTMVQSLAGRSGRSARPAVAFEATGSHVRYALEQFLQDPAVPIRISERRGGYRAQSAAARGLPTRGRRADGSSRCERLLQIGETVRFGQDAFDALRTCLCRIDGRTPASG